ncbi:Maltase-glucoamylase, intestinal [Folsomia candida]|uniref:Maltase-glucoamylase, intestinal n=1 Tax=Folsomia candida TaxID=158441 RepID=A0A226CV36_FOLCA|nr:Maltase-glucoamylase, intestinal [Folsomia candida]
MVGEPINSPGGVRVELQRQGGRRRRWDSEAENLVLEAEYQSNGRLRIKITPPTGPPRFEVPLDILPPAEGNENPLYQLQFENSPLFSFKVSRKATGTVLFDTTIGQNNFIYADQYLTLSWQLPSENVYGIGENEQTSFRHDFSANKIYPLWAQDHTPENPAISIGEPAGSYEPFELGQTMDVWVKRADGSPEEGKPSQRRGVQLKGQAKEVCYYDGMEVPTPGQTLVLAAPLDYIPLHVHGGNILPTQDPERTTQSARNNPFGLIIALDENQSAKGSLFYDDGGDTIGYTEMGSKRMDTIRLFGHAPFRLMYVNGNPWFDYAVNGATGEVTVLHLQLPMNLAFTVRCEP